jgi:hypothetical protein
MKTQTVEWISVDEALPQVNRFGYSHDVLCTDGVFVELAGYVVDHFDRRKWQRNFNNEAEDFDGITHWAELPHPP